MKVKAKTHKGMQKRLKITGKNKLLKLKAKRKQRFSRNTESKPKNTDLSTQIISTVNEAKIKKLLNIKK